MSADPNIDFISRATGRIPSGLFIITVPEENGAGTGYLGSFLMQVGLDPPVIALGIAPERFAHDLMWKATHFGVHVLEKDQNNFLKHFGRGFGPGEDAFSGLEIDRSRNGVPMVMDIATRLVVKILRRTEVGADHHLVVGEIVDADFPQERVPEPWVHLRKNGRGY